MTRASANCTREARERWLLRTKDPNLEQVRFQPVPKAPGSKVLQFGEWVEVEPER